MVKLISENGLASLSFNLLPDKDDPNYAKSLCFMVEFNNNAATMQLNQVWIYQEDLDKFKSAIQKGNVNTLGLNAMSEFEMTLSKTDELGHVAVKIKMENYSTETSVTSTFISSVPDLLRFVDNLELLQNSE